MSEAQAEAQNESALSNLFDNEDVSVDLSNPVFDNVTVPARLSKVEAVKSGGKDGGQEGQAIALSWELEAEAVDLNGRTYQPGHKIVDRFNVKPPSDMNKREEVQRIALQGLGRIARDCGKLNADGAPTAGQIVSAIQQSVGSILQLKLTKRESKTSDDIYQQIRYAKPGR